MLDTNAVSHLLLGHSLILKRLMAVSMENFVFLRLHMRS